MEWQQRRFIWSARRTRIRRAWCGLWYGHSMAYNEARVNDGQVVSMRCSRCNHEWLKARTRAL